MKAGRFLREQLRAKVLVLVVSILVLGFGRLLALNLGRERQALEERHRETARLLATAILTAVENGMMEGRPDIIRRLLHELRAGLRDVRGIDVYRRNGVEAFTDLETVEAVNRYVGLEPEVIRRITRLQRAPGQRLDHPLFRRAVETVQAQELTEMVGGGRILTFFGPLRNDEPCQQCHEPDHRVRGVVRISLGLDALDQEVARTRNRQIVVAGLTILGVAASIVVFLGRVVLAPIARVAGAARLIGGGHLDARTGAQSADEIGQLGRAIDDMAGHLQAARVELETRNGSWRAPSTASASRPASSSCSSRSRASCRSSCPRRSPGSSSSIRRPRAGEARGRRVGAVPRRRGVHTPVRAAAAPPLEPDDPGLLLGVPGDQHGDVNETAGDGLMVIFQSDGSQTRHALNAAGAAFRLLTRVAQLNREWVGTYPPVAIHVGINSGPALVGATKLDATGGGRWTFTASGPTTNLAARIAGLTRGGEVKVGPETAARIRDQYVLEDTGEHPLKNVAQPVRIYRLVPAGVYARVE